MLQHATSRLSISLPRCEREGGRSIIPLVGFPGGVVRLSPTMLLTAVLGRIRASSLPILLIAPAWPRQPRYSSLVELSHTVHLPLEVFPFLQRNFTHPTSTMFRFHAWTLLGLGIEDRDSLPVLPTFWLSRYSLQRVSSMTESETFSVYLVCRETGQSCFCHYREFGGLPFVFI